MKSFKGIIYAMVSSGTFGLIALFTIPLMMDYGMSEPSILFWRFLFSAIIMGVICLIRKDSFKINRKHFKSLVGLSFLYALTALFLIYAYNYIASGLATTIHFMYPICVSLIMVIFFKEPKSSALFIAALMSVVGVALMCWSGGGDIDYRGVGIAAITILTYGIYIVGLNMSEAGKLPAEVLTFYVLLGGAIIFFGYAMVTPDGITAIPGTHALVRILLLAFLATVISDLTLVLAVKYAGSTITSILGSMEPVVAVIVGVIVFSEKFTINSFFGLSLIILSVVLVILADKRNKNKDKKLEMEAKHVKVDK